MKIHSVSRGQSLIEGLVAMSLASIVVIAIIAVVTSSLSTSRVSGLKERATGLATETLEIVRNNRILEPGVYCFGEDAQELGSPVDPQSCVTPNVENTFIRIVDVTEDGCSEGVDNVQATVSWSESTCENGEFCQSVNLSTCLGSGGLIGGGYPVTATSPSPHSSSFQNMSASLTGDSATFNFTYDGSTPSYIVDLSTTPDHSFDVYLTFGSGQNSPVVVSNPEKWDKYTCGNTLYWRVYNQDRSQSSSIGEAVITCTAPTPNSSPTQTASTPTPTLGPPVTRTFSVTTSQDDGTWHQYSIYDDDEIIQFGKQNTIIYNAFARFTNVTISQGSTITNAYIRFVPTSPDDQIHAIISARDENNASAPTSLAEAQNATLTTANAGWHILSESSIDPVENTPDISDVIQEVVDRPGWDSGNAIVIFIENGGFAENSGRMYAAAYEDPSPNSEPQLVVTYR